ncbi:MAG: hypothetical protein WCQ21_23870 [Verrucomicrobiota bacterium]
MAISLPMVMPDYFEKTEARILQEFAEAIATWGQSVTALAAWEDEHLPLGIEARSHAGQRRYGWRRQSGGPVPPHPIPLPKERVLGRPSREMSGCLDLSPRGR